MDITEINESLISFSSKLLELKEKLEKTSSNLDERSILINEKESKLDEKKITLDCKEKILNEESERLESYKNASLMNKIFKESDNLKQENKLLKQSLYKKEISKPKDKINLKFLKCLDKDMVIIILDLNNLTNQLEIDKLKKINECLQLEIFNIKLDKLDYRFLDILKKDMSSIIDNCNRDGSLSTDNSTNNLGKSKVCKNTTKIPVDSIKNEETDINQITFKNKKYIADGNYIYNLEGIPRGVKTKNSYKLYKITKDKKKK